MVLATIKAGKEIEETNIILTHLSNLLDNNEKIDNVELSFRIKPTEEELSILNFAEEGKENECPDKIDRRKYIIHFVTKLKCTYLYSSKVANASEDIEFLEISLALDTRALCIRLT